MKKARLILIATLSLLSMHSQALLNCKKGDMETVTLASQLLDGTEKLYQAGLINKVELLRAQLFVLEAKLCSQSVTNQKFCETFMPLVRELNSTGKIAPDLEIRERISLLSDAKMICEN